MENGDLKIQYKVEQSIDSVLDKKIEILLRSLGYKWTGSGISVHENIRDIQFIKEN